MDKKLVNENKLIEDLSEIVTDFWKTDWGNSQRDNGDPNPILKLLTSKKLDKPEIDWTLFKFYVKEYISWYFMSFNENESLFINFYNDYNPRSGLEYVIGKLNLKLVENLNFSWKTSIKIEVIENSNMLRVHTRKGYDSVRVVSYESELIWQEQP